MKQHALRELWYFYDEDGSFNLRGRFPAEQGAMILKALDLAMERAEAEVETERRHAAEHWDGEAPWVSAETPTEAGAGVSAETRVGAENSEPDLRYHDDPSGETRPWESFATRRADALGQLAETYLAHGPKSTSTADRYQVVVHVSAETLKQEPAEPADENVSAETHDLFAAGFSYLEDGPHVSAETARRLGCDASTIEVTDDERGEPLNIGRKSRVIPAALNRALRMRDDGCRFPGCTHQHFIDGHHIQHWADGGETSLENVVQLCRHHHRLVHEHGFGCERTGEGEIRFTNPLGSRSAAADNYRRSSKIPIRGNGCRRHWTTISRSIRRPASPCGGARQSTGPSPWVTCSISRASIAPGNVTDSIVMTRRVQAPG